MLNKWPAVYHCPGVAVAFVDHFHRGSPDILGLALLHLPSFFPPAKQLLDTSGCRASGKHSKNQHVNMEHPKTQKKLMRSLTQMNPML